MSELPTHEYLRMAPPNNPEAERGFVGSLLAWPKYLDELKHPVFVECLYNPRLQIVYSAILELREDGDNIDVVTVGNRLKEKGQLEKIGGEFALPSLAADYPTGALAQRYADIIVDDWKRRSIAYAANDAVREAYQHDDPEDIQAKVIRRFDAISETRADEVVFDAGDVHDEVVRNVRKMRDEGQKLVGIRSGFDILDDLASGLVSGEMYVVGARPGVGKTSFALNALCAACEHAPVLLVSIEMRRRQLIERLISSIAGLNSIDVRHGRLSDEQIDRMHDARARIGGGKFWLADIPNANIAEITQVARQLKRKVPNLAVVAVDYLQLIRHETRGMKRQEQVADISGRLKALSGTIDVNVMALSQLNREVEGRAGKRPQLSDLRESGAIEQDADVVALIHRPDAEDPKARAGEADLIIAKNRNGPIGEATLRFDKGTTTFRNPLEPPPNQTEMEWPYGK
jgi:replicative DNA helicase